MVASQPHPSGPRPPLGTLLQQWRKRRRMSQLDLAYQADVSPRHVAFLETGRARPSREMVLHLAGTMDVPLRERNTLLLAAGFAPLYRESSLAASELLPVRQALDAILRQQEPYPAVVMNRGWDLLEANGAASRFFGYLLGDLRPDRAPNVLRLMFAPDGLRPWVADWEVVAEALLRRVHRESVGGVLDEATEALLREVLGYPGVPEALRRSDPEAAVIPLVPVSFRKLGCRFDFFSTVTTLGTPQDVTLQELRIECFFPVDDVTRAAVQALA